MSRIPRVQDPQICILSGVHDDVYRATRSDDPVLCTSAGKRKLLYHAIAKASGTAPLILSPPPRGHGKPKALPETTTSFAGCQQIFAPACGIRKVRYFVDFIHYARHVFRHTTSSSILVIDNYELSYVIAIYFARCGGRRNPVILEYEDGKHLIDKGIWKRLSGLAEWLGKPLIKAAILATPSLAELLPRRIPTTVIPGILNGEIQFRKPPRTCEKVHFLYSGSLDLERGTPLLLNYLDSSLLRDDVCIEITGQGKFSNKLESIASIKRGQVRYHGKVSEHQLMEIRERCHYGLNLQSSDNPISRVTFPSKTFDYLNAGLRLISTKAAGVESILGPAAIYLEEESATGLAVAIERGILELRSGGEPSLNTLAANHALPGTIRRLADLFGMFIPINRPKSRLVTN